MELQEVYSLWERFEGSSAVELELALDGAHLHLRKAGCPAPMFMAPEAAAFPVSPGQMQVPGQPAKEDGEMLHSAKQQQNSETSAGKIEVKAPLVGTFYRAPSPEAEPFVEVGQLVHKGDVIGLIEAMKLMNEITAPADGRVTEILAEDAGLVAFDDVLMKLEA